MSEREEYPAGVPCWVETLQPHPRVALDSYGPLFGWDLAGPGPMPGDLPGEYFVTRGQGLRRRRDRLKGHPIPARIVILDPCKRAGTHEIRRASGPQRKRVGARRCASRAWAVLRTSGPTLAPHSPNTAT